VQHESHLKTGVTPRCPEAYAARMTQFLKVEIQAIEILVHSFLLCGLLPHKRGSPLLLRYQTYTQLTLMTDVHECLVFRDLKHVGQ
jgi:hypothetical protein